MHTRHNRCPKGVLFRLIGHVFPVCTVLLFGHIQQNNHNICTGLVSGFKTGITLISWDLSICMYL